ncbi:hypothetical protein TF3313_1550 [Tannerella forsythia 3313]|nr:hypothetical protein TF3313_1550 [Tannerella forsythia 3313]
MLTNVVVFFKTGGRVCGKKY